MRRILIAIFFILLIIPVAVAKPETQSGMSIATPEITIVYPKENYFLTGVAVDLHFHAYNSTGYLLTNETTDCNLHIYNETGNHIVEAVLLFDTNGVDFYHELNSVEDPVIYGFVVWCNNSQEAGFLSSYLEFAGGKDLGNNAVAIFMILIFIVIYYFIMTRVVDVNDKFIEMLRVFWILGSMPLIWLLANTAKLLAEHADAPADIINMLGTFYRVNVWIILFTITIVLLYFGYKLLLSIKMNPPQ